MIHDNRVERYLDAAVAHRCYRNRGNLRFLMQSLYRGVDFRGKRVLDVGGGCGRDSFYAACRGASAVVCLEPEAAGSTSAVTDRFRTLSRALGFYNVILRPETLQTFDAEPESFDVVMLHNSINHLDESACIDLLIDPQAQDRYRVLFTKLFQLATCGANLILCDCSRYNFFAQLHIRNPFARKIEWHKHQSPYVWARLLRQVGFSNTVIRWSSFNSLRRCGQMLLGNQVASYFLRSHFQLIAEKPLCDNGPRQLGRRYTARQGRTAALATTGHA